MNTLKAVADPSAKILWSGDAQAGPAASSSSGSGAGTVGRNASTGPSDRLPPVVVVVAANGTILGTQSAGASQPTVSSVVGAAPSSFALGHFVPALAAALALLRA